MQPPSGGCVLKHLMLHRQKLVVLAAAFGRLCVETSINLIRMLGKNAAAFGRLCVETLSAIHLLLQHLKVAAAFGRLCVETQSEIELNERILAAAFGRLCVETTTMSPMQFKLTAAAFGRLCVETRLNLLSMNSNKQPPSGGCVLKQQQKDANKALTIGSRLRAAVC